MIFGKSTVDVMVQENLRSCLVAFLNCWVVYMWGITLHCLLELITVKVQNQN